MAKGYITLPVGYERVDNLPLLIDQTFDTYEEAVEYASSDPTAYVGQIFTVLEEDYFDLYIVNSDLTISSVGSSVDLSSINISTFSNDSGYITEDEVTESIESAVSDLGTVLRFQAIRTEDADTFISEHRSEPLSSVYFAGQVWLCRDYDADGNDLGTYTEVLCLGLDDEGYMSFEKLGSSTNFDLSNYYTKDEVDALITEQTGTVYAADVLVSASEDDSFTVQLGDDGECGGYSTGDVISSTDDMYTILYTLLVKSVAPTYEDGYATLTINTLVDSDSNTYTYSSSLYLEAGTYISTLNYTVTYVQNDAGAADGMGLYASTTTTTPAQNTSDSDGIAMGSWSSYGGTKTVTISSRFSAGARYFQSYVHHAAGDVKTDNLGNEYSDGQIAAGFYYTNTVTIYAAYYLFWESSSSSITAEDSDSVRSLANSGYVSSSSTLDISISEGDLCVVIAYPTSYGEISSITQATSNLDVKSSFEYTTVSVSDASGSEYSDYYVYTYTALAGLNEDTFTVAW